MKKTFSVSIEAQDESEWNTFNIDTLNILQANSLRTALSDFDSWLRNIVKYGPAEPIKDPEEALQLARKQLHTLLAQRGIEI